MDETVTPWPDHPHRLVVGCSYDAAGAVLTVREVVPRPDGGRVVVCDGPAPEAGGVV